MEQTTAYFRDMLFMIDIALWEYYYYLIGSTATDDGGSGGKAVLVERRNASIYKLETLGVRP